MDGRRFEDTVIGSSNAQSLVRGPSRCLTFRPRPAASAHLTQCTCTVRNQSSKAYAPRYLAGVPEGRHHIYRLWFGSGEFRSSTTRRGERARSTYMCMYMHMRVRPQTPKGCKSMRVGMRDVHVLRWISARALTTTTQRNPRPLRRSGLTQRSHRRYL